MNYESEIKHNYQFIKDSCRKFAFDYKIEPDDLLSMVNEKLARYESKFDGRCFRAWVYTMIRNAANDMVKTQRHVELKDEHTFHPHTNQSDCKLILNWISKFVTELPLLKQNVYDMYFISDLSIPHIAETTGETEGNIRITIFRLRQTLKTNFMKYLLSIALFAMFSSCTAQSIVVSTGTPAPSLGTNGNVYIDNNSWNLWYKQSNNWVFKGNIKGAQGIPGQPGRTGPQGPAGVGTPGATGPQGSQGAQGATGARGPAGPTGASGSGGGGASLPAGNNFDVLTYFNGGWTAIPGTPRWQSDVYGATTGVPLGSDQIDQAWTDYVANGFVKVNSISSGASVTMHVMYVDTAGVHVDYQIPVATVGTTIFDPTHILYVAPFIPGGVQFFTTVVGTVNYDARGYLNIAP